MSKSTDESRPKEVPLASSIPAIVEQKLMHFRHDHNVQRYRDNETDKCPTEMIAARSRAGMQFGSPEYLAIDRACALIDCSAKYHWCPTCCLAPRCNCLMYHMSPVAIPMHTSTGTYLQMSWVTDQASFIDRLGKIPCDDRYGAFVLAVKSIARDETIAKSTSPGPFCLKCTIRIQSGAAAIGKVFGRTYLEQAHHLWKHISPFMCNECIGIINKFPCLHMDAKCPSAELELITARLKNYQSRKTGQVLETRESTQISSIRSAITNRAQRGSYTDTNTTTTSADHGDVEMPRSSQWTRFWFAPNGPIRSLPRV